MFRHRAVIAALFALTSLLQPQAGHAAGDNRTDREAVADLIYCYARGTDAIGDATTNADPLATGLAIYRGCFAADAEFRAWFPQQPFDSQTFPNPDANPDTAPAPFIGPAAWAQFVNGVFRGSGYDFTQHIMSNVDVQLKGTSASVTLNGMFMVSTAYNAGVADGAFGLLVRAGSATSSAALSSARKPMTARNARPRR